MSKLNEIEVLEGIGELPQEDIELQEAEYNVIDALEADEEVEHIQLEEVE
ncbi:hypothetical protein [Staphylococcus massiliensis]|nr:hypothetical protein [Staphylococcus massiliensis]